MEKADLLAGGHEDDDLALHSMNRVCQLRKGLMEEVHLLAGQYENDDLALQSMDGVCQLCDVTCMSSRYLSADLSPSHARVCSCVISKMARHNVQGDLLTEGQPGVQSGRVRHKVAWLMRRCHT